MRWDADGNIQVRHQDSDKKRFGQLHQFAERGRPPQFKEALKQASVDMDNPQTKELLAKMGSYLEISGQSYFINAAETSAIFDVVTQRGGIIPNWPAQF